MKELCTCNTCSIPHAIYRNPWCSLLQNADASCCVLHLWYKIEWLKKEVEKRSSYLGKFRRTEEAKHLLDLISMTQDETDLFIPFAKDAMADVYDALHLYMPKHEKAYFWREGKDTVEFTDDPLPDPPVEFYKGQYVIFNEKLYMAIEDGDSDDFADKIVPTEDYRDSIHYGILLSCKSNVNAIDPVDTAVFEALVARIIFKWLQYSYPEEAPRYKEEFEEHLEKIKTRVRQLDNNNILDRIPRIF